MKEKWEEMGRKRYTRKRVSPLMSSGAPSGGGLSDICLLNIPFMFLISNNPQMQCFPISIRPIFIH